MALEAGTQLGSFEITGRIGAGGMGEVYRATDTKLGRDVAIKTLPASLADDKDRLARFEREAKLLASLNHAHIASVYNLDEHDGTLYIAMELVEGETLEERLRKGALPVDDALQLGLQIALALEAAHEKGVVHRDLKPANIMISPDGVVKVLDFGLAKAFSGDPDEASPAQSPALSVAMTQQGLILGTAGYMSPEQASGQATDQRADIWSFGVVLYEMLTGMPVFSGESVPHVLADVLKTEPDWNRLPKNLPWRVRQTLERCLTKKPRSRMHSIADARIEIETSLSEPDRLPSGVTLAAATGPSRGRTWATAAGTLVTGLALASAVAWILWPAPAPTSIDSWRHIVEVDLAQQGLGGATNSPITVSPDGRAVVFGTTEGLHLLRAGERDSRLIPGAVREQFIAYAFFSPDGQRLAFFDQEQRALMRLSIDDGVAQPIVVLENESFHGGSWGANDTIVYATSKGLYYVDANGDQPPERILVATAGEEFYRRPQLLPDGDSILVSLTTGLISRDGLAIDRATETIIVSIESPERVKVLFEFGGDPVYVETGHIVYARGDELYAVTFDIETLSITSDHRRLVQRVARGLTMAPLFSAPFSIADDLTLVYFEGELAPARIDEPVPVPLVWFDPTGNEEQIVPGTQDLVVGAVSLSPDGEQLLWSDETVEPGRPGQQFRLWRAAAGEPGRTLVYGPTEERISGLYWIDDERAVISIGGGFLDSDMSHLAVIDVYGDGTPEPLQTPDSQILVVTGLTPEGDAMLVTYGETSSEDMRGLGAGLRVGLVPIDPDENGEHPIEPLILGQSSNGQILPGGDWIIYESFESGNPEIYIARYPELTDREAITDGEYGSEALLSPAGDVVYYIRDSDGAIMKVSLDPTAEESPAGQPEYLSEDRGYAFRFGLLEGRLGEVAPDGRLLVRLSPTSGADQTEADQGDLPAPATIVIDRGFGEDLKALTPTD